MSVLADVLIVGASAGGRTVAEASRLLLPSRVSSVRT
ncbi:hypothetical protein FHU36_007057 [Nonomuraea muscovyensis]|uniref:Uncharacterized protein n=1 Tax=Nonomuraea muscovyensis TaxID=1124761 RepID=A0A7X0C8G1_9ACTN|nr:hypothetical protein [Nonomuraea muscovyensis]